MKFRDRLRLIFNATFGSGHEGYWRDVGWLPGSGTGVNADTVLGISGVWKAVNVIGKDIAALPIHKYKRLEQGKERVSDDSTRLLNGEPNLWAKSIDQRFLVQVQALLRGNGYAEIQRDPGGRPLALWWLPTENVSPEVDSAGLLWYIYRQSNKPPRPIRPENLLHIKGMPKDEISGLSVVALARQSLSLTLGQETYAQKQFENGIRPSLLLKVPGKPSAEQRKELRDEIDRVNRGASNAFNMLTMWGGMEASPWSMSNDDAQWLEGRQFQVEEIARWFDLPPHKLGALGRATWNNVESMQLEYVAGCLNYWFRQWEQECNKKLRTEREKQADSHFYEFLSDALLRGETLARMQSYAIQRSIGLRNPNELRALENLPPREDEGGESYDNPNTSPGGGQPNAPGDSTDQRDVPDDGNRNPRQLPLDPGRLVKLGTMAATEAQILRDAANASQNFTRYVDSLYDPQGRWYSYIVGVFGECELDGGADEWCRESLERITALTEKVTQKELPRAINILLADWPQRANDFCLGATHAG